MKTILRLSDTECQSLQKVLHEHAGARVLHALILLILRAFEPRLVTDLMGSDCRRFMTG